METVFWFRRQAASGAAGRANVGLCRASVVSTVDHRSKLGEV